MEKLILNPNFTIEDNEKKPQEERRPHLVKTIGKTTYLVTCHFSKTWQEGLMKADFISFQRR